MGRTRDPERLSDRLYMVVNVDIVRSRDLLRRRELRNEIRKKIKTLNKRHGRLLLVHFATTVGDEYQGVLKSPQGLFSILWHWEWLFYPIQLRFGMGVGRVETAIAEHSREMDGEVFRLARQAIRLAKSEKRRAIFRSQNPNADIVINALLLLVETLKQNWQKAQLQRCWLYRNSGSLSRVAKKEQKSRAAIRETLASCHFLEISEAERNLEEFIENSFFEDQNFSDDSDLD